MKFLTSLILSTMFFTSAAQATLLRATLATQDSFNAYISTNDATQGSYLFGGNNPGQVYAADTTLNAGEDYFLHIEAFNAAGAAGLIGHFALHSSDHQFYNGNLQIHTNADWVGNPFGFNAVDFGVNELGDWGEAPWGAALGVSPQAHWIWSGPPYSENKAYFSVAITATTVVPAPLSLSLLALGLLGLVAKQRTTAIANR